VRAGGFKDEAIEGCAFFELLLHGAGSQGGIR
jgi:hypothetical protein